MKKLLLIVLLILAGCSSAEEKINTQAMEEIERGRYTQAALLLQEAVKLNPDYLEGMVNYRNVYPRAVDDTQSKIDLYNQNEDYVREASTYENMLSLKEGLYMMDPIVHNKLGLSLNIPQYNEIEELKMDAGVSYYNAGNTFEGLKLDRYRRREKFFLYDRGQELYPRYRDIGERTARSLEEARIAASFTEVTGDSSRKHQIEGEGIGRIKNRVLEDPKLSKITIFKDIPQGELREALRRAGNLSEESLKDLNTVVKINIDSFTYNPTRVTRDYYTRYWTEKYYVIENNVKVAKYRERSYTEIVFDKRNSSRIVLSYEMIDLEDGRTIGSGVFEGNSGDRYRWSVIRGRAPAGVMSGVEREIKSGETIIGEAIVEASDKLGRDIRNNI